MAGSVGNRALLPIVLLAIALASGCGGNGTGVDGGADGPAPAPATCDGGIITREVTFPSLDGLILHGTWQNPCGGSPRPTAVLAHQLCQDRGEWSLPPHDWVAALNARGVATLAFDLRGHGQSTLFPDGTTHDLCQEAADPAVQPLYAAMVNDVKAAITQALSLGAPTVGLVGSSIGANASIVAYGADTRAAVLVALSPGIDYRGIRSEPSIFALGARITFLEAAEDDPPSAEAVRRLYFENSRVLIRIWPTGGHGNRMIDAHPEELEALVNLVSGQL